MDESSIVCFVKDRFKLVSEWPFLDSINVSLNIWRSTSHFYLGLCYQRLILRYSESAISPGVLNGIGIEVLPCEQHTTP
jgi:hypothetical protein